MQFAIADIRDDAALRRLVADARSASAGWTPWWPNAALSQGQALVVREQWNAVIDVNLTGTWRTPRAVIRR